MTMFAAGWERAVPRTVGTGHRRPARHYSRMERARFILRALKLGASPGWGFLRQLLSIAALIAVVLGLQVVGLPLVAIVLLGFVLVLGVFIEGSFRLWAAAQEELSAAQLVPKTAQDLAPNLSDELNAQLRRGRKLRSNARFSSDGAAGPLEMWEQEVAMLLEDHGRHDFAVRFETAVAADKGRALISGPWATRRRIDRKLRLLGVFIDAENSQN